METSQSKRRKSRNSAEIDITPMIDVVFLMLIFFIVCSTLGRDAAVQLPKAEYGVAVNPKTANVLILSGVEDELSVSMMSGGQKVSCSDNEEIQREEIIQFIQNGIRCGRTDVVIQADRRLHSGEVMKIESIASVVSGIRLYIVVKD